MNEEVTTSNSRRAFPHEVRSRCHAILHDLWGSARDPACRSSRRRPRRAGDSGGSGSRQYVWSWVNCSQRKPRKRLDPRESPALLAKRAQPGRASQDHPIQATRVTERELHRDQSAHRQTTNVRLLDIECVHQRGRVVGHARLCTRWWLASCGQLSAADHARNVRQVRS
jgi:hypothetical protein